MTRRKPGSTSSDPSRGRPAMVPAWSAERSRGPCRTDTDSRWRGHPRPIGPGDPKAGPIETRPRPRKMVLPTRELRRDVDILVGEAAVVEPGEVHDLPVGVPPVERLEEPVPRDQPAQAGE